MFRRKRGGQWVARVYVRTPSGASRPREFTGATRDDALGKLYEARDRGLLRQSAWSQRPLRDFALEWLASRRDKRPTTREADEIDVSKRIVPAFGATRLSDIGPLSVARWIEEMRRAGVGKAAIARSVRCLSTMLSSAVSLELIAENPVKKLARNQRPGYRPAEAKTLTLEQLQKLLTALLRYRYGAMAILCGQSGMRQGEALALRWTDIDFRRNRISVNKAIVQVKTRFHEGATKTESSERWITVPTIATNALRAHRRRMKAEGHDIDRGRVFLTRQGKSPQRGNILKETLLPALHNAELPRITWRELRHTFASASIEKGAPLEALSRMLGHRDPSITLRVYNKAFRAQETMVAELWNKGGRRK